VFALEDHIARLKQDPTLGPLLAPLFSLLEEQALLIEAQAKRIADLEAEVAALKARLNQTSRTSHKPPSSDGYRKQPAPLKPKSGQRGGQRGHKGDTLKMVETPDEIDLEVVTHCRGCGQSLSESDQIRIERRQQFELPEARLIVREFQRPVSQCSCCGALNQAAFGEGVSAPAQYGPGIEALCVLLHNDYHIPLERVSRLLGDVFSQPINAATILAAQHRVHDRLAASEQAIGQALLSSPVLHVDETGLRAAGKLHWLHGASTALLSYFFVHPKRGKDALWSDQSLLPAYLGHMIHDCFASYFKFSNADHSLCGSHLLRELDAIGQSGGQWAEAMHTLLLEAYWDVRQRGILDPASYYRYKQRYFAILRQGLEEHLPYVTIGASPGRKKRGKARSLIHRLVRYHKQVWAFALVEAVPFTNNQAERDIRMVKLKQKINGGFRTKEGADVFARIAGFCSTLRKQGQSVFSELKRAMQDPKYVISLKATASS